MKFPFLRGFPDGSSLTLLWAFAKFAGIANGLYGVQKVEVLGKRTRNRKRLAVLKYHSSACFLPNLTEFPFHGRSSTKIPMSGQI